LAKLLDLLAALDDPLLDKRFYEVLYTPPPLPTQA